MLVPIAVWGLAALSVTGAAAVFGYAPFDSATWSRFDSGLYEDIARNGYELFPCDPEPGGVRWCGDAGWFPLYPWLMNALDVILPLRAGGVVLSWLFAAATIVFLWATFFRRGTGVTVVAALVFAAFVPGRIYHYAVFPLSLLALSSVACLWFLHRERWVVAGLAGAVAALSYPLGVLLIPVSALWILLDRAVSFRERLRRAGIASGLMTAGFAALLVAQWIDTGRWNAYFLVQEKYDHDVQNPVAATWRALEPLVTGPFTIFDVVALQTAIVTLTVVLVLAHAAVRLRERRLERLDVLLLLWLLATWLFPLSQSNLSIQRSHAALVPMAILVARLPRTLLVPLAIAAVPVAVLVQKLFLDRAIV